MIRLMGICLSFLAQIEFVARYLGYYLLTRFMTLEDFDYDLDKKLRAAQATLVVLDY